MSESQSECVSHREINGGALFSLAIPHARPWILSDLLLATSGSSYSAFTKWRFQEKHQSLITVQQNIWKNLNYLYRIETFCTCKILDPPWFVPKPPNDCMLGEGICLSSVNSDIVFTGNTKMRRVWQCLHGMRTLINFTEHVTYRKVLVVRWGMQEWVEPCQVLSQFHQCCLGPGFYNWYCHFCTTWDAAKDDT